MMRACAAALLSCLILSGCASLPVPKTADRLSLKETTFDNLPGWDADMQGQAVAALQRSCTQIAKKPPEAVIGAGEAAVPAANWQQVCGALVSAVPMTDAEARAFFEAHFTPYTMQGLKGAEGLFTGYYEPTLRGSLRRHGDYQIPLYGRPDDLVTLNLGDFRPELKGENLVGRLTKDMTLVPYYDRADIEAGALEKQRKEIVWVDDAVDAFFLHIQGSGRVVMEDGKVLRVGYAVQNGRPYLAIGKELLKRGALEKGNVSMQSIRGWLESHPDEAAEVMNLNASYIFFRELKGDDGPQDGPLGAQGVALTPGRSLAVDRKLVPYGAPIWIDAAEPEGEGRIRRLMVAQDTGGAITGAVRGDFFWGAGDEAAHKAGLMKSKGRAWILLPKAQTEELNDAASPESAPAPAAEPPFAAWFRDAFSKLQPKE
jgi:membrane-bound lytic murein transglycosylase A